MNKNLIAILERARAWPTEAQEELLELALEIEAEIADGVYTPLDAEQTVIPQDPSGDEAEK